jgi:hypothetical protein
VDVLGHDDITAHDEEVALANAFQCVFEEFHGGDGR